MAYYNRQPVQAIDYLKEAILQAPHSIHLRLRLADIYREENLFAEASKQYQFLIENKNHQESHRKLAEIYSMRGLHQEALKSYKHLENKEMFSVSFYKARFLIEGKKWVPAFKIFR